MILRSEGIRRRFGFDEWGLADVGDERVHFRDFRVRELDIPVWHVLSRRRVLLPQGIWLDRATWTQPADVYQRLLLVESYECRTRGEAQDLLVGLLAQFQVPPDLAAVADARGGHAFVDQRGGDSLFVIGNVAVRVATGSTVPAPAHAVADHVRTIMATRSSLPHAAPAASSTARRRKRTVIGDPVAIDLPMATRARARRPGAVAPPSAPTGQAPMMARRPVQPEGYLKVFSRHGEVRTDDDDRLVFVPDHSGLATLELYDVRDDGADAVALTIEVDEPS